MNFKLSHCKGKGSWPKRMNTHKSLTSSIDTSNPWDLCLTSWDLGLKFNHGNLVKMRKLRFPG